jgi:hypothetical protein
MKGFLVLIVPAADKSAPSMPLRGGLARLEVTQALERAR